MLSHENIEDLKSDVPFSVNLVYGGKIYYDVELISADNEYFDGVYLDHVVKFNTKDDVKIFKKND